MKLESVHIKRFRSIEDDVLDECGNFNVLIGKNNSGKSNVLSAISAFFTCAGNENIVSLNPPNGREIDFFGKNTETPIEISVTLALSETERAKLLSDIIDEAPQMKNAVDGFPSPLSLSATVTISPPLRAFSIVSKLALVEVVGGVEHLLFGVNRASAMELRDKAAAYQTVTQDTEEVGNLLSRLGENIWEVLRSGRAPLIGDFMFQLVTQNSVATLRMPLKILSGTLLHFQSFRKDCKHSLAVQLKKVMNCTLD